MDTKNNMGFTNHRVTIAMFSSVIATILAITYYVARLGFDDNSLLSVFSVLSISFFILFLSPAISILIVRSKSFFSREWYPTDAAITLLGILLLAIAGILAQEYGFNLLPFFAIIGLLAFIINAVSFFSENCLKKNFIIFPIASFFSLWLVGIAWGSGYQNPLFFERIAIGQSHIDTLFHSSISNMISSYGVPSTGLDGIPYIAYHFGSHWLFAKLSNLLIINPIDFYQLGYQIIFIPLLLKSMLSFILELRMYLGHREQWDLGKDIKFWLVLLAAFIGFLPPDILAYSAVGHNQIIGESYSLSITFLFFILSLLLPIAKKISAGVKYNFTRTEIMFLLFGLPILILILGYIKISMIFLLTSVLAYLFLRQKLYRNIFMRISMINIFLAFIFTAVLGSTRTSGEEVVFFHFIRYALPRWSNSELTMWPILTILFLVFHFFWSWLYIGLRLRGFNFERFNTVKEIWASRKLMDIEILVIFSLMGLIPGAIISLQSNAYYFSDVQRWVALCFILANIPALIGLNGLNATQQNSGLTTRKKLKSISIFLLSAIAIIFILGNTVMAFRSFVTTNLETRYALNRLVKPEGELLGSKKKLLDSLLAGELQKAKIILSKKLAYAIYKPKHAISENGNYETIRTLKQLSNLPLEEKRKTLIFVPRTNYLYWNMLEEKSVPFVVPAISGIAMVDGLPGAEDFQDQYYGYAVYNFDRHKNRSSADQALHKAKSMGFSELIILDFKNNQPSLIRKRVK